jgi:hypothetical protein
MRENITVTVMKFSEVLWSIFAQGYGARGVVATNFLSSYQEQMYDEIRQFLFLFSFWQVLPKTFMTVLTQTVSLHYLSLKPIFLV